MSNCYTLLTDRTLLTLQGTDARQFLQGLVTCDVRELNPEQALYGALLTPQGKYFADFFLVENIAQGTLLLDVDRSFATELYTLLLRYRMRAQVEILQESPFHLYAAWGELALLELPETAGSQTQHSPHMMLYTDPRQPLMGARLIGHPEITDDWLQQRGFADASMASYEHLRLRHGIPHSSRDFIHGQSLLLENGMEELHGVSFTKGCFIGQEVTARSKHRAQLRKLLYQIHTTDHSPLPASGTAILQNQMVVGEMRSTLGSIGMAMIKTDAVENGAPLEAGQRPLTAFLPVWRHVR